MSSLSRNSSPQAAPPLGEARSHRAGTNPDPSRLTRRQILALPIIAAAPNLTLGAQDAGISEATLRRWRKKEHFSRELDRLTRETADLTQQQMESLTRQSSQVLSDLIEHPDPMVRLRAARAVVALGVQVSEACASQQQTLPAVEENTHRRTKTQAVEHSVPRGRLKSVGYERLRHKRSLH